MQSLHYYANINIYDFVNVFKVLKFLLNLRLGLCSNNIIKTENVFQQTFGWMVLVKKAQT